MDPVAARACSVGPDRVRVREAVLVRLTTESAVPRRTRMEGRPPKRVSVARLGARAIPGRLKPTPWDAPNLGGLSGSMETAANGEVERSLGSGLDPAVQRNRWLSYMV